MYRIPHRGCRFTATTVVLTIATTAWLLAGAAAPASAAGTADSVPLAVNDLPTVINNMTAWITGILAAVATLFLTIGGARYLMAGGDPSEVERAKGSLKSAGIGYGLALLAPIILTILKNILGA
ncbi:pilin [Actinoplanes sp. NPDC049668]|uniref:pilin n=1 Tax=unclassified Actinoplanes TaxID=2626549 RepID=UPI0033BAE0DA